MVYVLATIYTPPDPDDERDAAIELQSARYTKHILASGELFAIAAALAQQVLVEPAGSRDEFVARLNAKSEKRVMSPVRKVLKKWRKLADVAG